MAVEEPPFRLRLRDGAYELRDYPALTVAEVTVDGDQGRAAGAGFRLLAGYIFGGNGRRQSIAMTAPVTQVPAAQTIGRAGPVIETRAADRWIVRFTMPQGYTLDRLPPANDPRVRLRATPAARVAVVRFSGVARESDLRSRAEQLAAWIRARGLHAVGPASLAQYDPPWTLWFLRRNEVMIPVGS